MSLINFITKVKNLFVVEKLGVGTATPLNTASVVGRISVLAAIEASPASGKTLQIYQNDVGEYGELFSYDFDGSAALPLVLQRPGGNVGIKNIAPSEALDVTGNIKASGDLIIGDDAGITGDLTVSGKIINNSTRYQYNFDLDGASKSWTLFTLAMDTEFRKEIFVSGTYYGPPAHVNSRFDYTEFKAYIKDCYLGTGVIVKTFEDFTLPDDPYVPSVGYTITLDGLDVVLTATGIATDDILDLYIQVR